MLRDKIRAAWAAPRPPGAPARVWRDWLLVAAFAAAGLLEALLRTDLVWPAPSVALLVPLSLALLWRRVEPAAATALVFVAIGLVEIASLLADVAWEGLSSMVVVLVVVYALGRWGSGREIAVGMVAALTTATLGVVTADPINPGDVIGGYLILLFTVEVGIIVRSQAIAQAEAIERTKLQERELLARELHDTVAHHVSAIAIQAQAGRTLAANDPGAAVDALRVIEEEASRTLTEMRTMVGTLRQGEQPAYAPQPGVADIEELADTNGGDVRVDVELTGDLDQLRPAVDAALFRLAQESITNAVRHARNATRVAVQVYGGDHSVRLTVDDDGDGGPELSGNGGGSGTGYGLVGMRERATLLGGTLEAGPKPDRGWTVSAILPRDGGAA